MRTRSRLPIAPKFTLGDYVYETTGYAETMTESSYPGSCNVYHVKHKKMLHASTTYEGKLYTWNHFPGYSPPIPLPTKLDWGKLPTSSEFGIIQFFAELDDTIALFGKRFWKELTYGSFTWGVLPFVNDVKALLKTISTLTADVSKYSYEDAYTESVDFDLTDQNNDRWRGTMDIKYHLTGVSDISFQDEASRLLDRLGFHPDLATAWDLVPLSFVVDWVLPVGDFLESLRGGGWVKVAIFNGWQTAKCNVRGNWTSGTGATCPYENEVFYRFRSQSILSCPPTVDPVAFELPSFRELFNMAYLAGLGKKLRF